MMDPLPSSPIEPGWTTAVAPSLQRTVAVAPIRTMTMTTAGLARKTADWSSDSVAASDAEGTEAARKQATKAITRARAAVEIVPSLDLSRRLPRSIPLLGLEPLPRGVGVDERLLLAEDLVLPGVVRAPFVGRDHRGGGDRRLDEKVQPQRQDLALHVEVVRPAGGITQGEIAEDETGHTAGLDDIARAP